MSYRIDLKKLKGTDNFVEYYKVVDCEHEGDIRSAQREVEDAGGIIDRVDSLQKDTDEEIDDYYESREWWIVFHCDNKKDFAKTCYQLGIVNEYSKPLFDKDIKKKQEEKENIPSDDDELELMELEAEAMELELSMNIEKSSNSSYPVRNGNIDSDDLKNMFGFRYVNVDINLDENEEQQMQNVCYDTFMQLAMLLKIPMKAIGLGRNLTLNIGIKKMQLKVGGCYVHSLRAMNFKSLEDFKHIAHEWFHAFDHYLAYTFTDDKENLASASQRRIWICKNEQTYLNLENLVETVLKSDYYLRSEDVAMRANDDYWKSNQELLARAMEIYIQEEMNKHGIINNHLVSLFQHNPYPDFSNKNEKGIKTAFDKLFGELTMKSIYDIDSLFGTN